MNAIANLYVHQHLQELLDESARERLRRASQPRKSRTRRIVSALQSLRQAVSRRQALPA